MSEGLVDRRSERLDFFPEVNSGKSLLGDALGCEPKLLIKLLVRTRSTKTVETERSS